MQYLGPFFFPFLSPQTHCHFCFFKTPNAASTPGEARAPARLALWAAAGRGRALGSEVGASGRRGGRRARQWTACEARPGARAKCSLACGCARGAGRHAIEVRAVASACDAGSGNI